MPTTSHSINYRHFCQLLQEERRKKNITQSELAEKLKKPQSFVSKYETAERRLDFVEFIEIMDALCTNPMDFIETYKNKHS